MLQHSAAMATDTLDKKQRHSEANAATPNLPPPATNPDPSH